MNIKYIKFKDLGRTKILLLILTILIVFYIGLGYLQSSEVVASKVEFENEIKDLEFVLGGESCGIKLLATGVLVVEVDNGSLDLEVSDVILKVDDTEIDSNAELIEYINKDDVKGKEVTLTIQRGDKTKFVKATPIYNEESGKYELGLWVKDSSAGVGMVTFYELNNKYFAALGHGITETSKNVVLPIQSGAIVKSKITSINRGYPKEPGDIRGTIYKEVYGQIRKNTINGIYGVLENTELIQQKQTIKVAYQNEIKQGKAQIYCTLDDNMVKAYDIEITNVLTGSSSNKNMILQVTDKTLLEKTGGIVQGMSGSPIVQDGKLIGAVTHVFLNDPTKGYAVFIENMIEDMISIEK